MFSRSRIPSELVVLKRWVGWRTVSFGDRITKVLYSPRTLNPASSTDERTWSTLDDVLKASKAFHGVGLIVAAPYCAIDLDQCRDPQTQEVESWAQEIIDELQTYTEVSPSGRGFHLWCRAALPVAGRKRAMTNKRIRTGEKKKPALEVYASGRYLTFTTNAVEAHPIRTLDLTEWFKRYFGEVTDEGDSDYEASGESGDGSTSASEFALACRIVRDLGPEAKIEILCAEFLRQATPRPKLKRPDYVRRTLRNAINTVRAKRSKVAPDDYF